MQIAKLDEKETDLLPPSSISCVTRCAELEASFHPQESTNNPCMSKTHLENDGNDLHPVQ